MRYDERKEAEAFDRGLNIGRLEAAKDLAAAEERGRRRGVEEVDRLKDALRDAAAALTLAGQELIRRLNEKRERMSTTEVVNDEVAEAVVRAVRAARAALAPRDSAPVCDAVVSSDPFREWRCGKAKGHEGPHSGQAPRDSGKEG